MTNTKSIIPEDLSDEALLMLAQAGGETALDLLLRRYKPLVRRKARAFFLQGCDREDLVQEGMIGLVRAVRSYDQAKGSFVAFAELCCTRQMISAVRSATRRRQIPGGALVPLTDLMDARESQGKTGPEELLIGREDKHLIEERLLAGLSAMERRILSLYLRGMPYAAIALDIGRDRKTVDNALQRARRKAAGVLGGRSGEK